MSKWKWISTRLTYAVHDRQIAEHGGRSGLLDRGMVEAALARPQHLENYESPDAADFAAAYAFAFARNHAFNDGNKRVAWILARLFLLDNGRSFEYDAIDAISMINELAAGRLSETEAAEWFRSRIT